MKLSYFKEKILLRWELDCNFRDGINLPSEPDEDGDHELRGGHLGDDHDGDDSQHNRRDGNRGRGHDDRRGVLGGDHHLRAAARDGHVQRRHRHSVSLSHQRGNNTDSRPGNGQDCDGPLFFHDVISGDIDYFGEDNNDHSNQSDQYNSCQSSSRLQKPNWFRSHYKPNHLWINIYLLISFLSND